MSKSTTRRPKDPREPAMLAAKKYIAEPTATVVARDERKARKRVLVAQPHTGPVNVDAVIDKVMTRFPKVLAHLAK